MNFRHFALCVTVCILSITHVQAARTNDNIMGTDRITVDQLSEFLIRNNPTIGRDHARRIAQLYDVECRAEGVRTIVAFAQMCHETGFLRFGNDVRPEQNNFCGFGAIGGGARGNYFPTMNAGIRAHVQHLKAYASRRKINQPCIDSRRKLIQLGSAKKVGKLSGRWAADMDYGKKILAIMQQIQAMDYKSFPAKKISQ
ncbi:MAG: glucosaminidase domain-containing protein [Puniceicoccales bacterium]|jgi:hypothetical protein|nr:glucosaminidase domain-containing protein [Puniceicoccales bacterium]